MLRIAYLSEAQVDPCGQDLRKVLEAGSQRNLAHEITGLLLYSGDHVAEILEGDVDNISSVMGLIRSDRRHRILREWAAPALDGERWFVRWSIGYVFDQRLEIEAARLLQEPQLAVSIDALRQRLFEAVNLYTGPSGRP